MASQILNIISSLQVTDVQDVIVSAKAVDPSGAYVRSIKIYGGPDGTNGSPVFTLILSSDASDKISVSAPETNF